MHYKNTVIKKNPLSYWRMSADPVLDEMLRINSEGAAIGTVTRVSGGITGDLDQASNFTGASDYYDCGANLDFGDSEPMSFAFWFKTSSSSAQTICYKRDATGNEAGYEVTINDPTTGAIAVHLVNIDGSNELVVRTTATSGFTDGAWHFCVITYAGTELTTGVHIYVDNVDEALTEVAATLSASITCSANLRLGGAIGDVDEIAIFDYALSYEDLAEMYYAGKGKTTYELTILKHNPYIYYKLDETSGTTATDQTTYAIDGTYVPAFPTAASGLCAASAGAITFNGTTQYITFDSLTSEALTDGGLVTVSLWFKVPDLAGASGILFAGNGAGANDNIFALFVDGATGGIGWAGYDEGGTPTNNVVYGADFDDNVVHHVAVTWTDNSTSLIYVDGALLATHAHTGGLIIPWDDITKFSLAQEWDTTTASDFFDGTIDEFSFCGKTLTSKEIWDIYSYGKELYEENTYKEELLALAPLAYWRLGDTGATAVDETQRTDGTYNGTLTKSQTSLPLNYSDTCVSFDGSSGYVDMGNVLAFEYTQPFSIALWMKADSFTSDSALVSKMEPSGVLRGYLLRVNSSATNKLEFLLVHDHSGGAPYEEIQVRGNIFLPLDTTFFVVLTYDGSGLASGVNMYVDSVKDTSITILYDTLGASTTVSTTDFNIAAREGSASFFDGFLDEVSIFDRVLTDAEICRLYYRGLGITKLWPLKTIENCPAAYWRLEETSGSNAADFFVTHAGTHGNTPTLGAAGAVPNLLGSYSVTYTAASDEYTAVSSFTQYDYNDAFSVSCWVKLSIISPAGPIVGQFDIGTKGWTWEIYSTGEQKFLLTDNTNTFEAKGTKTLNDGYWHFVTVTYDGSGQVSGVNFYADGNPDVVASTPQTGTVATTIIDTGVLTFAARDGGSDPADIYLNGSLDEVAIYDSELNAAAIKDMYISGLLANIAESLDVTVIDNLIVTGAITNFWSEILTESINALDFLGLPEFIAISLVVTDDVTETPMFIERIINACVFADPDPVNERVSVVIEALLSNTQLDNNINFNNVLAEGLTVTDLIRISHEFINTETVNFPVADQVTFLAYKTEALVDLLTTAGILETSYKVNHIIAEIFLLLDIVERGLEAVIEETGFSFTADATYIYTAIVTVLNEVDLLTADTATPRFNTFISDAFDADDATSLGQKLNAALLDGAFFGGSLVLADGVFSAYVVNTRSLGLGEFTNYPFNSFGKNESDYLGATDDKIYALSGADDDGTNIDAVVRTGLVNFGTNLFKRVPRAYLGYTSDGGLIMKVISTSGGTKTERWYELTPRTGDHASDAHAAARIKLGRGVKATYWQFELINKEGAEFDMDTLQLYPMVLSRRV